MCKCCWFKDKSKRWYPVKNTCPLDSTGSTLSSSSISVRVQTLLLESCLSGDRCEPRCQLCTLCFYDHFKRPSDIIFCLTAGWKSCNTYIETVHRRSWMLLDVCFLHGALQREELAGYVQTRLTGCLLFSYDKHVPECIKNWQAVCSEVLLCCFYLTCFLVFANGFFFLFVSCVLLLH